VAWPELASFEYHGKKFIVEVLGADSPKRVVTVCSVLCCRGIWAAAASQHTFFLRKKQLVSAACTRGHFPLDCQSLLTDQIVRRVC